MISNNLALLSQNVRTAPRLTSKNSNYSTNPQKHNALKYQFQAKIKQSHMNLFNFINILSLKSVSNRPINITSYFGVEKFL